MTDDRLLFELSDGIAILTLNRPEVMNAFEDGMREALFERLEECEENRDAVSYTHLTLPTIYSV